MEVYGLCGRCHGHMAILDILQEGYDLICTRCGARETIRRALKTPPPCFE